MVHGCLVGFLNRPKADTFFYQREKPGRISGPFRVWFAEEKRTFRFVQRIEHVRIILIPHDPKDKMNILVRKESFQIIIEAPDFLRIMCHIKEKGGGPLFQFQSAWDLNTR